MREKAKTTSQPRADVVLTPGKPIFCSLNLRGYRMGAPAAEPPGGPSNPGHSRGQGGVLCPMLVQGWGGQGLSCSCTKGSGGFAYLWYRQIRRLGPGR